MKNLPTYENFINELKDILDYSEDERVIIPGQTWDWNKYKDVINWLNKNTEGSIMTKFIEGKGFVVVTKWLDKKELDAFHKFLDKRKK